VTKIDYEINKLSFVQIKVYDILGKLINSYINTLQPAGRYSLNLDASGYTSGIYFYEMFDDNQVIDTKKMIVLK